MDALSGDPEGSSRELVIIGLFLVQFNYGQ